MDGLRYQRFTYRASTVHLLRVDLSIRSIRLIPGATAFPFKMTRPILDAVDQGALAATGCGFNMQTTHGTGVSDQPLHALVIDGEIWTTGIGGGGHGFLIGDGFATTRRNRIQVHVWRPDRSVIEVEHVNRGHEGAVVAFTRRGGENEHPIRSSGKFYVELTETTERHVEGDAERRTMIVTKVSDLYLQVWPKTIVLESVAELGLKVGNEVGWVQRLGALGVHSIVSGWPEIVHDGENVTDDVELDPEAPAGGGPDNWFVKRGPRLVLGASLDGTVAYMVAVEGRLANSVGLRLRELGTWCRTHGLAFAANMDGGGSVFEYVEEEDPPLVFPGVYNTSKTLEGIRPDHVATSVF